MPQPLATNLPKKCDSFFYCIIVNKGMRSGWGGVVQLWSEEEHGMVPLSFAAARDPIFHFSPVVSSRQSFSQFYWWYKRWVRKSPFCLFPSVRVVGCHNGFAKVFYKNAITARSSKGCRNFLESIRTTAPATEKFTFVGKYTNFSGPLPFRFPSIQKRAALSLKVSCRWPSYRKVCIFSKKNVIFFLVFGRPTFLDLLQLLLHPKLSAVTLFWKLVANGSQL